MQFVNGACLCMYSICSDRSAAANPLLLLVCFACIEAATRSPIVTAERVYGHPVMQLNFTVRHHGCCCCCHVVHDGISIFNGILSGDCIN